MSRRGPLVSPRVQERWNRKVTVDYCTSVDPVFVESQDRLSFLLVDKTLGGRFNPMVMVSLTVGTEFLFISPRPVCTDKGHMESVL